MGTRKEGKKRGRGGARGTVGKAVLGSATKRHAVHEWVINVLQHNGNMEKTHDSIMQRFSEDYGVRVCDIIIIRYHRMCATSRGLYLWNPTYEMRDEKEMSNANE